MSTMTQYRGEPIATEDLIIQIAKDEGIPESGLTILGGKPYVNTTGLDVKLRNKCNEEKLVHIGTEYVPIQVADKDNEMRAGGWGIVKLFDKTGFEKALTLASKGGPVTKDVIDSLKELYFRVYKMRGWASPSTLQMSTMKTKDNIEAMAERRATNRAKREATGTGLTSLDEGSDEHEPIDQAAHDMQAARDAAAKPVADFFGGDKAPIDVEHQPIPQQEAEPLGDAFVGKAQMDVMKGLMQEFRLGPPQFGTMIESITNRRPKSFGDVRKPEFQAIVKAFDAVRRGDLTMRDGKIERPPA